MARTVLFVVSVAVHAGLAASVGAIPRRTHRETVAITMTESKKKPPPPAKIEEAPRPPDPLPNTPPARAPKAPTPTEAAPDAKASPPANAALAALPDFGVALDGAAGPGGVAVPAARAPATATSAAPRTLARAAPKPDDCDEPPTKPKLVSMPRPQYPAAERASGVEGKVRVELSVDAAGKVVAARVVAGLGPAFDGLALAAARAAAFEPAQRCGKPSAATFKVGIQFQP